jgi:hypothetical protein
MATELEIEREIQNKGLNAPRLTPSDIDNAIVGEDYYVFPNTTFTVCLLTLKNGFNVSGESATASLENFDAELGRKIARDNARTKIWELEGYLLKQKLWALEEHLSNQKPVEAK